MVILGIMSGSSLDGIDYAVIDIYQDAFEILSVHTQPIPDDLVLSLKEIPDLALPLYKQVETTYTKTIGETASALIKEWPSIALISIHGHTVLHHPDEGYSVQLLNGGMLAAITQRDVLCDVRAQAIGVGSQGAPLAPLIDPLFPDYDTFINLGGISNISQLHDGISYGFDMGPCNQLSNFFAVGEGLSFDKNGALGRRGTVIPSLIAEWKELPYYQHQPPKSISNSWVKKHYLKQEYLDQHPVNDLCATAYAFIAWSLAQGITYLPNPPRRIMVTGGGAYNGMLMEAIEMALPTGIKLIIPPEDVIEYKECVLMAYLGLLYQTDECATKYLTPDEEKHVPLGCLYKSSHNRCN